MRSIAIVAIIAIGLPAGIALGRYGSLQPCDMLAMETVRLRSYGSMSGRHTGVMVGKLPGECLVALGRVFTQDPVDVMVACMRTELGASAEDISKAPLPKVAAADKKCSSLGWFLWREESSP